MSTESKKKSGRTPEQQAARDARKAAKAQAKAALESTSTASASVETSDLPHAESSAQAIAAQSSPEAGESSKKRRREAKDETEVNEEDLLEIDVDAPEPLSKAEARANRKRQKKGLPELPPKITKTDKKPKRTGSDAGDDAGEQDGEETSKEDKEKSAKRQNSVWIGNLSFRTTAESLKDYIETGIVKLGGEGKGSATRVNLPKKAGKGEFAANKGFAFVDFSTPGLQDMGVQLSESFFEGRKLLIKKGNDHTVKPDARTPRPERAKLDPAAAGILKKQIHPESATLFVGNLPFDATEEGLRDMIEDHAAEVPEVKTVKPEVPIEEDKKEDEEEEADEDGNVAAKTEGQEQAEWVNKRGGKKSGLRKVRLGAFEDTGRCKGFAFLDFNSPQEATRTLVNRKNHFYGSRKLNVQYASDAATKRSGGNRNLPEGAKKPSVAPGEKRRYYQQDGQDGEADEAPRKTYDPSEAPVAAKKDQRGKRWEATGRPRPGAALAMAKRENVGIVKGEGEKITFD